MKLKQSKVFKAGIGYTIGNVMVKGINFLAIPIFSRLLTTEEMGLYTVFAAYEAVLFVFIGMALHSSIRSAKYEFEGKIDDMILLQNPACSTAILARALRILFPILENVLPLVVMQRRIRESTSSISRRS